jgi:PPK2 family polyphosphate:nucleotide phosphotransferase
VNCRDRFIAKPGSNVRLDRIDPGFTGKKSHKKAEGEIASLIERMARLQYLLYADAGQSILVVLQGLDAAGKDGVIRHIFTGMNPQGTRVFSFRRPTDEEEAHDFLWRIHPHAPRRGEVVIFNRSHYEDVLVVRVHELVSEDVWSRRYQQITGFEELLAANGTRILKFYLHISPDEQLKRFEKRLDTPDRQWKISEEDYQERDFWPAYVEAYQDALERTSTSFAPWYIIPSNHKWFRNLAISQIIAKTMDEMQLELPRAHVDIADIRKKYHAAKEEEDGESLRRG